MDTSYQKFLEDRHWYNRLCNEYDMEKVFVFLSQPESINKMINATSKDLPAIQGLLPDFNDFLQTNFSKFLSPKFKQIIGSMVGFVIMQMGYVQGSAKKISSGLNSIFSTAMVFKKDSDMENVKRYEDMAVIKKLANEYKIEFTDISKHVTIKIYKDLKYGIYFFEQSHYVKTPEQGGPYRTSTNYGDTEATVLRRAMLGFKTYLYPAIEESLKKGNSPDPNWLVENPDFY